MSIQKTLAFPPEDLADLARQRSAVYWEEFNSELVRQLAGVVTYDLLKTRASRPLARATRALRRLDRLRTAHNAQ